ncbi:hypothetical protein C4553_00025 [Candidatus Parcubacteria bacterium]|nr:MAG: hypothetical protein C4553_00025 [Candidatus Parcubacteria bacterium]
MSQKNKLLIIGIIVLGFCILVPDALAARLYFKNAADTVVVGSSRLIELRLDTEGEYINAGEVVVSYQPDFFDAVELYESSSIFDIFITRPVILNNEKVFLSGGATNAFQGDGLILTTAFVAKKVGQTQISASQAEMIIADGQGSLANLKIEPLTIDVVEEDPQNITISGKIALIVSSPTHPVQTKFYSSNQVVLTWNLEDAYEYSYAFSRQIEEPDDIPEERVSSVSFFDLEDGIYFFNLKAVEKDTGQKAAFTSFRVMVDTEPPEAIKVAFSRVDATTTLVAVNPQDKTSGVDIIEYRFEGEEKFERLDQFYFVAPQSEKIIIRVYDRAGNFTERVFEDKKDLVFGLWGLIGGFLIGIIVYFAVQHLVRRKHNVGLS